MNNSFKYSFNWASSQNVTQQHAKCNLAPCLELPVLKKLFLNAYGIGNSAHSNLISSADKLHNQRFFNTFVLYTELRLAPHYQQY